MGPGEMGYVTGYASPARAIVPSLVVSVQKLGNGYVAALRSTPPPPKYTPPKRASSPYAGEDPDKLIDQMIDGMGALVRSINDKGAGEEWKDEENRAQVRKAFRIMFPSMASQIDRMVDDLDQVASYEPPREENLVFESKEKLVEYLTKNL